MYTENIIRDINYIIYEVKQTSAKAYHRHKDADRTFTWVKEEEEADKEDYKAVCDGLVDASEALDQISSELCDIQELLYKLIDTLEMEALSAKVQAK